MKTDKKLTSIAGKIVQISKKNGEINEAILAKFLNTLKKDGKTASRKILLQIEKKLKKEEENSTLKVESAFKINESHLDKIREYFEKKENKSLKMAFSLNKKLISGLRVQLGDTVWENSAAHKLEQVTEALIYD